MHWMLLAEAHHCFVIVCNHNNIVTMATSHAH